MEPTFRRAYGNLLDGTDKRTYTFVIIAFVGLMVFGFSLIHSMFGLDTAIYGLIPPLFPEETYSQSVIVKLYGPLMATVCFALTPFVWLLIRAMRDEKYLTPEELREFHALIQDLGFARIKLDIKDTIEAIDRAGRMPVYYELRSLRKYVKHQRKLARQLRRKPIKAPEVGEEYKRLWQSIVSETLDNAKKP